MAPGSSGAVAPSRSATGGTATLPVTREVRAFSTSWRGPTDRKLQASLAAAERGAREYRISLPTGREPARPGRYAVRLRRGGQGAGGGNEWGSLFSQIVGTAGHCSFGAMNAPPARRGHADDRCEPRPDGSRAPPRRVRGGCRFAQRTGGVRPIGAMTTRQTIDGRLPRGGLTLLAVLPLVVAGCGGNAHPIGDDRSDGGGTSGSSSGAGPSSSSGASSGSSSGVLSGSSSGALSGSSSGMAGSSGSVGGSGCAEGVGGTILGCTSTSYCPDPSGCGGWTCTGGQWFGNDVGTYCNPGTCPDAPPASGDSCAAPSLACTWNDACRTCTCATAGTWGCSDVCDAGRD